MVTNQNQVTNKNPQIGVFLPTMAVAPAQLSDPVAAARHAEAAGLESVWVIDQLIAGRGVPFLDATVALSAAAAATERVGLGFGVLIAPLHHPVWAAKRIASLQHVSGGRVLLGLGVGGDRHEQSWAAAGVARRDRGRLTDEYLHLLPDLIAGDDVTVAGAPIRLAPGAPVPPILVGGASDAALQRTARHAASWFAFPGTPGELSAATSRIGAWAVERGRRAPRLTASLMVSMGADPAAPDPIELTRLLTDPDGMYGIPVEAVDDLHVRHSADSLRESVDELAAIGAERIVVSVVGGDWFRQVDLIAGALAQPG